MLKLNQNNFLTINMYKIFEKEIIIESKKYVNELLKKINDNLYFHKYSHSIEVLNRAVELGIKEGLNEEKLELLAISAIFHDTGFIKQYDNNEEYGATIAEIFLKEKKYPKEKIEIIKKIILATIMERKPNNILEEIIKDADLDNLGRDDFIEKTNHLKKEIENIKNKKIKNNDWYKYVLELIYKHKFYTRTENNERLLKKLENIKVLKKLIEK